MTRQKDKPGQASATQVKARDASIGQRLLGQGRCPGYGAEDPAAALEVVSAGDVVAANGS